MRCDRIEPAKGDPFDVVTRGWIGRCRKCRQKLWLPTGNVLYNLQGDAYGWPTSSCPVPCLGTITPLTRGELEPYLAAHMLGGMDAVHVMLAQEGQYAPTDTTVSK